MLKKHIAIGAVGLLLAAAAVGAGGYIGYQSGTSRTQYTAKGKESAKVEEETSVITNMTEAAAEELERGSTPEDTKKNKRGNKTEKKNSKEEPKLVTSLKGIQKLSKETDPGDWKEMKLLAESIYAYCDGQNYDVFDDKRKACISENFPEVIGISGLPMMPGETTGGKGEIDIRKETCMLFFRESRTDYTVTAPITDETIVNINGFNITLGKTKMSELRPMLEKQNAYVGRAKTHKELYFGKARTEGIVQYFQTADGRIDEGLGIEFLPMSGIIIGVKVYMDRNSYDPFTWVLDYGDYDGMSLEDVQTFFETKSPAYESKGLLCFGNGTTEDQKIYEGGGGKIVCMRFSLAGDRIQRIKEN